MRALLATPKLCPVPMTDDERKLIAIIRQLPPDAIKRVLSAAARRLPESSYEN